MTEPLPKWVMQNYAKLWKKFRDSSFDHPQATKILKENVSVILSHLRKKGWLDIALNPKDSRKRVYALKNPEKAISEMANEKE